jgi:hypothetical protein
MQPSDICVATMMLARTLQEEQVLRDSMRALSRLQLPVFVADGGSPASLTEYVAALPGMTVLTPLRRGLVPQVHTALTAAHEAGHPFILYTEPDKTGFFERGVIELIQRAPSTRDAGVILASRNEESFATFPPLQRFTESTINRLTGNVIGQVGDYSYGPFLLNRALVGHVDGVPTAIGWGWRHYLFAIAHHLGLGVLLVTDDFPCPLDQRDEDDTERANRMGQLSQNVDGLMLALRSSELRI